MPAVFEYQHTVRADEIDAHGHVNNVNYFRWMQSAAVAHSAAQGWPTERYEEARLGWVARRHEIDYLQPAFDGDVLVVRTWVADFRKITSWRRYRILRPVDNVLLATAQTNWAFLNLETRMPTRIPADLVSEFQIVEGDDPPVR